MSKYVGGVAITGFISPTDTSDTYATHDSVLGRGGLREVNSLDERDAIPGDRRRVGMIVYVLADSKYYALFGDTTNLSWKDCGTQLGGYDELLAEIEAIQAELEHIDSEFDQVASRLDKLEGVQPTYEMAISLTSTFDVNELLFINLIPHDLFFEECLATCLVPDDAMLTVQVDDESIGTIAFTSGSKLGVVNIPSETSLNRNSILTIIAPQTVTNLADVGVHITFTIRENV